MTISYAQNQEDIWLNRVFADKTEGFYIDVGAHMPETDSVTKLFYDRGWRGINLELIPELHALFLKERPRDINLQIAAGAEKGTLNLHTPPAGQQGVATLDPHTAELVRAAHIDNSTLLPVQVSTLADICWEHAPETIDFLKIDVEGFEKNVILGMDFKEFRPIVLVVEAVQPWKLMQDPVSQAAYGTWHDWEPLLMDAGYIFATFDGLSRYYVRKEDRHLVAKFIIPVSPLVDGYVKFAEMPPPLVSQQAQERIESCEVEPKTLSRYAARFHYTYRVENTPTAPQKNMLTSKVSTQADIDSPWCAYWTSALKMERIYHRKIWEQAFVPQALYNTGMLQKGKRGIVFGCGREPLPSLFASLGCSITATDAPSDIGWVGSTMYADSLENLYYPSLVDKETFSQHVTLEYVDMNALPQKLDGKYDFCWSICAFEHLGSLQAGMDFVKNSLRVLKKGGTAVHTTEFNYANDQETIATGNSVLYQKKHFAQLVRELQKEGHRTTEPDYTIGEDIFDRYVDQPPYSADGYEGGGPHLKLNISGYASTCFGIIITKK